MSLLITPASSTAAQEPRRWKIYPSPTCMSTLQRHIPQHDRVTQELHSGNKGTKQLRSTLPASFSHRGKDLLPPTSILHHCHGDLGPLSRSSQCSDPDCLQYQ
ncbi:hypothetical protein ATANTOWER_007265 [Ataeniobius toweri]|uniref:Uncharacterized protein n=1 Tax=Ataeniobius toweri TaxID=208326 RepID=A0ABU7CG27_9TELE|nr:hypothetical protein [Ataeniobius toweri]